MEIHPYLPGLHLPKTRGKARSAKERLAAELDRAKQKSFSQLGACFGRFIPGYLLRPSDSGALSRRRLFSKENTFWSFFCQVLDTDGGCKEVVRKLQVAAVEKGHPLPSSSTAAYCKARQRLELSTLESIHQHLSDQLRNRSGDELLSSRRIVVVDGTGLSMPDTEENQEPWPQSKRQNPGCGFPQARLCACFNLHNGALISYALGNKKSHELMLLREQWDTFEVGDILLGDKGFCSYYDQSKLRDQGVDSIITLARRRPVEQSKAVKVLGENDLLIHWPKPKWNKHLSYSVPEWEALPEKLLLRQVKVIVDQPGFRTKSYYIVTTLLDAKAYPAAELAEAYRRRWDVELFFRDIKTTMDMDVLRCKSPEMVRKEIVMHLIVYNCIRALILEAARDSTQLRRIGFKGALQAVRKWEPCLKQCGITERELRYLIRMLYRAIADNVVPLRPGRHEPRAVKRRPKNYQRMTKPRHEMIECPHRSKYTAQNA